MIYVKFQVEFFKTPTSEYSHLGTLTALQESDRGVEGLPARKRKS